MTKQNLVIVIIIVVSLVIGGLFGFYFYLNHKAASDPTGNTPGLSGFFNFGSQRPPTVTSRPSETSTTTPIVINTVPKAIPALRHLTTAPVAGFSFIDKDLVATSTAVVGTTTRTTTQIVGTAEVFRWIDRATGNIFETSSTTLETSRISNVTIPKVYEAFFADNKGTSIIVRGLTGDSDTIETKYGVLQTESATSSVLTVKLTDLLLNITQMTISPNKEQIFGILPTNIRGFLSRKDGSNQTNIFSSPFHEWLVSWPTAQTIVLNTKPSGVADGYAYTLNPTTRAFVKLVGNKKGLTTLMSPDGNQVLVGESPLGTMKLNVLDRRTSELKDLYVRTLPEKCVWSRKQVNLIYCAIPESISYNTYPDAWYVGTVTFSDIIWSLDVKTNEVRQILQPVSTTNQTFDVMNMTLSKDENFLMFQDKNDLSLWSYQLNTATSTATSTAN